MASGIARSRRRHNRRVWLCRGSCSPRAAPHGVARTPCRCPLPRGAPQRQPHECVNAGGGGRPHISWAAHMGCASGASPASCVVYMHACVVATCRATPQGRHRSCRTASGRDTARASSCESWHSRACLTVPQRKLIPESARSSKHGASRDTACACLQHGWWTVKHHAREGGSSCGVRGTESAVWPRVQLRED